MPKFILFIILVLTMTGCATSGSAPLAGQKSTPDRMGRALISPLSDLNILPINIPPVIQGALKNPYQIPNDISCQTLADQIDQLDAVLGTDLDAIVFQKEKTAAEKGQEFLENEAIGSVERTISGVIPFRSWIRKFTGAEKRSRELNAAIAAGVVRRAFLKGIGQEHGCKPPAAPLQLPRSVVFVSAQPSKLKFNAE